jgi:hypothetical protein
MNTPLPAAWLLRTCLCLLLPGSTVLAQQHALRITEVSRPASPQSLPRVAWVAENDHSWQKETPVFTLKDEKSGTSARGWLATTNAHILLRVVVSDDNHYSDVQDNDIWNGDGLQIGLDVRGDSTGTGPADRGGVQGPDDAAIAFALGKKGPQAWVHGASRDEQYGELKNAVGIVRNEKRRTTTYDVALPWRWFASAPGLYPYFRCAVQVNDMDARDPKTTHRLKYGDGAGGGLRTFLFKKLAYAPPPAGYNGLVVAASEAWQPGDSAEVRYAVASRTPATLTARVGAVQQTHPVPGDGQLRVFSVKATPGSPTGYDWLTLGTGGAVDSVQLKNPDVVVSRLEARLDSLLPTSPHPLFTRHLKSVKSLVMNEWAALQLYKAEQLPDARETLRFVEQLADGFAADAGRWDAYLDGRRSLFFAYVSRRDRHLSYYMFTLPDGWAPEKKYPLLVELHGSGNPNPLSGPASQLGNGSGPGYKIPKTDFQLDRKGYHLYPFGRGNTGYLDIGEIDVMEALGDVHRHFAVDEDRRYLLGFSMGGGGTWNIGARTPDQWAAIAIFAGVYNDAPGKKVAANLKNTPVWMWCGDKDFLYPHMQRLEKEMKDCGLAPVVTYQPDIGHAFDSEAQKKAIRWLQGHVRRRPDTLSFVADTEEHPGAWGIRLVKDYHKGLPSFTCTIAGNRVTISSTNATALEVNLGEKGLGLRGDAVVVWNGREVYSGAVALLNLSEKGAVKREHPAYWFDGVAME